MQCVPFGHAGCSQIWFSVWTECLLVVGVDVLAQLHITGVQCVHCKACL